MLQKQKPEYIDSDLRKVFHFLELKGEENFLIGSNKIRNILHANDYDLNSNIEHCPASILYKEFIQIFEKAYANPLYYIIDFKCGVQDNGEPIRWTLKKLQDEEDKFKECLSHENNTIKLDMCYIHNSIFTDINCLYVIHHTTVNDVKTYKKVKAISNKTIIKQFKEEINELQKNHEYYKAMKRLFSMGVIEGKYDPALLEIMNSDYGMYYKFISFLKLVVEMIEQTFKPIEMSLLKTNLVFIKQFASHITDIKIDSKLNELNEIIGITSKAKMKYELNKLITTCSNNLDSLIKVAFNSR